MIPLLVLVEIEMGKQQDRGNLRSGRVIDKDFKRIGNLNDQKKGSRNNIDTYKAMPCI